MYRRFHHCVQFSHTLCLFPVCSVLMMCIPINWMLSQFSVVPVYISGIMSLKFSTSFESYIYVKIPKYLDETLRCL